MITLWKILKFKLSMVFFLNTHSHDVLIKPVPKQPFYTFNCLPNEIKQYIFAYVMGNRIDYAQKAAQTLLYVSKDFNTVIRTTSPTTCVPFTLLRLFEHARKGVKENKVKACINFLVRKKYRADQLMLSRDVHRKYLMQYLVDAKMKEAALTVSKIYKELKQKERLPYQTPERGRYGRYNIKDAHSVFYSRKYPLTEAVYKGNVKQIKKLLRAGVHPDMGLGLWSGIFLGIGFPWEYSYRRPNGVDRYYKFAHRGDFPNDGIWFKRSLNIASEKNLIHVVRLLLDYGACPTSWSLKCACKQKNFPLFLTMVEKIPHLEPEDEDKSCYINPLESVLFDFDSDDFPESMLRSFLKENKINPFMMGHPFMWEVSKKSMVLFLIKNSEVIGPRYAQEALITAAELGWFSVLKEVIRRGVFNICDMYAVDRDGYSALDYAWERNNVQMLHYLEDILDDMDDEKIPDGSKRFG